MRAAAALAAVARQHRLVVTHGNGPQVGLLAIQDQATPGLGGFSLDVLGAETEGMIGAREMVLMREGDQVFREVQRREEAIHSLLVNTRTLATELEGVARDNEKQLGPALRELRQVLGMLQEKKKQLRATAAAIGPYADILGNIVGTGPWFDGYVVNLLGIPTQEFVPGTGGDF